jgi:hypothetical protein
MAADFLQMRYVLLEEGGLLVRRHARDT